MPIGLRLLLGFACIGTVIYCRWRINHESVIRGMGSNPWGWIEQAPFPGRTLVLVVLGVALIVGLLCFLSVFFGRAPAKKA